MDIEVPAPMRPAPRCIATIISPDFACLLDDLLGSLAANGACNDALIAVFVLRGTPACETVITSHGALRIACRERHQVNVASKSVLYSVARVIEAEHYLCLDADMLVLSTLAPLFEKLGRAAPGRILACREANAERRSTLGDALLSRHGGATGDIGRILGTDRGEGRYPLVVNDGLFAGDRAAMLALDAALRRMPGAVAWLDGRPELPWRNEFLFNLALATLDCGVELSDSYNVQLDAADVEVDDDGPGSVRLSREGNPVRILHLNGRGRDKYPQLRGRYALGSR